MGCKGFWGGHGAAASLPPNPWCCPPGTQASGPLLAQDPASLRRGSTKKPPVASSLKRQGEPRPSLKKRRKFGRWKITGALLARHGAGELPRYLFGAEGRCRAAPRWIYSCREIWEGGVRQGWGWRGRHSDKILV